jgi:hypothetical protein
LNLRPPGPQRRIAVPVGMKCLQTRLFDGTWVGVRSGQFGPRLDPVSDSNRQGAVGLSAFANSSLRRPACPRALYFDGARIAGPILVLAGWAAFGTALVIALGDRIVSMVEAETEAAAGAAL